MHQLARSFGRIVWVSTNGGSTARSGWRFIIEGVAKKGVNYNNLAVRIRNPAVFRPALGGRPPYGYEATIMNDLCDAGLEARQIVFGFAQGHVQDFFLG
jgi:hypothetical protein